MRAFRGVSPVASPIQGPLHCQTCSSNAAVFMPRHGSVGLETLPAAVMTSTRPLSRLSRLCGIFMVPQPCGRQVLDIYGRCQGFERGSWLTCITLLASVA